MSATDERIMSHAVSQMLPQLLIVLVQRLGGEITIPATEIDGTGRFIMTLDINHETRSFTFRVLPKQ